MPERLPQYVQHQILSLYFEGLSQSDVAKRLGIAQSTVSLEIGRFMKEAKASMESACEKYGIAEFLRGTHHIAKQMLEAGLTIPKCLRAFSFMERLDGLGRALDDMEGLFQLYDRAKKEPAMLDGGLKLLKLEAEAGKTYQELLADFERKLADLNELNAKVQSLREAQSTIESELRDVRDRLLSEKQRLESIVATKERLDRLGLDKVNELAAFIEDYEKLGFNAEDVRELSSWRARLKDMGADPDNKEGVKKLLELSERLEAVEKGLAETVRTVNSIPISNIYERFKCGVCGSKHLVAVRFRCTKCGMESWWGIWPKH